MSRQRLTVNEIINILEEEGDEHRPQTIIITGPEEGAEAITDEDSDESDAEVTGDPTHLPRRVLDAEGQLHSRETLPEESQSEQPSTYKGCKRMAKKRKLKDSTKKWSRDLTELNFKLPEFIPPLTPSRFSINQSPFDSFRVFFSEDFVLHIVEQTNMYANLRGNHGFSVASEEIYAFLGILLFSGYHFLPRKRLFWNTDDDCNVTIVRETMRRNRFDDILRYLHLADNTNLDTSDRLYKIRPIFQFLNRNFKLLPPRMNCCVDETIIPYCGKHGAKQFIKGKPIRFGFKLWCLAESNGHIIHAEPYGGLCTRIPKSDLGQGGDVVVGLLEKSQLEKGSRLFFDNLFTSEKLLYTLKDMQIGGTGTLRENRVKYAENELTEKNKFKKEARGTMEERTNGDILVTRWNDNAVVTMMTNCIQGGNKVVNRYSRKEKKNVTVPIPLAIAEYNKFMGGVDLCDQLLAMYRVNIRTKKWWWPFFAWAVDVSCVQGWLLHRHVGSTMDYLQFRRECALYMMRHFGSPSAGRGFRQSHTGAEEIRTDHLDHLITKGSSKYKVCAQCKKRTVYICKKCNISLHPECFLAFHEK
ncbi:piggyBac transposable element-derived protein 3-like [Ischnura elegans]|uniref:piggyBac transposable element-derived protein 3-like n=1 Tax=Ischnura elegans TaxID=197161 RepID=UPI001ED87067|nr:piggyBac transposable element-derived protein 3-like [Ischnura elegans]